MIAPDFLVVHDVGERGYDASGSPITAFAPRGTLQGAWPHVVVVELRPELPQVEHCRAAERAAQVALASSMERVTTPRCS